MIVPGLLIVDRLCKWPPFFMKGESICIYRLSRLIRSMISLCSSRVILKALSYLVSDAISNLVSSRYLMDTYISLSCSLDNLV